jgi:hypothetical protein
MSGGRRLARELSSAVGIGCGCRCPDHDGDGAVGCNVDPVVPQPCLFRSGNSAADILLPARAGPNGQLFRLLRQCSAFGARRGERRRATPCPCADSGRACRPCGPRNPLGDCSRNLSSPKPADLRRGRQPPWQSIWRKLSLRTSSFATTRDIVSVANRSQMASPSTHCPVSSPGDSVSSNKQHGR